MFAKNCCCRFWPTIKKKLRKRRKFVREKEKTKSVYTEKKPHTIFDFGLIVYYWDQFDTTPKNLATKIFLTTLSALWNLLWFIDKRKKNVIIPFSIIPPTLAQIIILLFFTKHMAYNINFCEGNLEAVPAWFWFSLRTKQKNLTLFANLTQL